MIDGRNVFDQPIRLKHTKILEKLLWVKEMTIPLDVC